MPGITPLPDPPSVLDPENFSEKADAFVAALQLFVTELNAIIGLTIPAGSASANTLTGDTLADNVLFSSLTSLGTITSLLATSASLGSVAGAAVATQAQQETGTSVATIVTPGRQQFHPSAAKAWVKHDAAGNVNASYNIASVSDGGTGIFQPIWAVDFSSADYVVALTLHKSIIGSSTTLIAQVRDAAQLAGGVTYDIVDVNITARDPLSVFCVAFGDQ